MGSGHPMGCGPPMMNRPPPPDHARREAVQLGSRPFLLNAKRRAPKGTSKLKAIDEEDSFDIASQAASDISGKATAQRHGMAR